MADESRLAREALTYISHEDLGALEAVVEARDRGALGGYLPHGSGAGMQGPAFTCWERGSREDRREFCHCSLFAPTMAPPLGG